MIEVDYSNGLSTTRTTKIKHTKNKEIFTIILFTTRRWRQWQEAGLDISWGTNHRHTHPNTIVQIKTPKVPNKISRPIRRERHDIKSASGPISSLGNDVKGLRFGCVYYIGVILIGSATVGYLGLWTNNLCFWSEQELFQLIVTPYNDFRKTYQFAA